MFRQRNRELICNSIFIKNLVVSTRLLLEYKLYIVTIRTYIIKFWNANNYRNVWSFLDSTYTCVNKLFIADIRLTIMPLVTEINGGITAHDQSFDRLKQAVLWKDSIKVDKMFPLS